MEGKVHLNQKLKRHWDEKMQFEHRDRVANITRYIDNSEPPKYQHMIVKPKRIVLQEERF